MAKIIVLFDTHINILQSNEWDNIDEAEKWLHTHGYVLPRSAWRFLPGDESVKIHEWNADSGGCQVDITRQNCANLHEMGDALKKAEYDALESFLYRKQRTLFDFSIGRDDDYDDFVIVVMYDDEGVPHNVKVKSVLYGDWCDEKMIFTCDAVDGSFTCEDITPSRIAVGHLPYILDAVEEYCKERNW